MMLRSRANTLLSVRRVSERNAGRKTAGVDGEVVLSPKAKMDLAEWVQRSSEPWRARPVKRVYIPKQGSSGKRRPLGIPVIVDRVQQARVVSALEPEWEARFEPRSYGFRPGRGCHDAIAAIYVTAKGKSPKRPVGAGRRFGGGVRPDRPFPHPSPARLVPRQGNGRAMVEGGRGRGWPVRPDRGRSSSRRGDQPRAAERRAAWDGAGRRSSLPARPAVMPVRRSAGSPVLIRYADDLVALCHTRDEALKVKARLASG